MNMKPTTLLLLPLMAAASLTAQPAPESTNVPPPPPPQQGGGPRGGFGLSQAERDQLKTAREKALAADPALQQKIDEARKVLDDAQKALNEAMIKADPSVEAIIAKMPKRRGPGGPGGPGGGRPPGGE